MRVLNLMSGSPVWGSAIKRRSPSEHSAFKARGLDCRSSTELEEINTSLIKYLMHRNQEQIDRSLDQTYLLVLEGPLERQESQLWLILGT